LIVYLYHFIVCPVLCMDRI